MKTWIMMLALVAAVVAVYILLPRGVMPLDEKTLERFQEASSRHHLRLMKKKPELAYPVRTSLGMRKAIRSLGYDPDDTLLYWMSPGFRMELQAEGPEKAMDHFRLIDNLLAIALGEGSDKGDVAQILDLWSEEVAQAARARRGR